MTAVALVRSKRTWQAVALVAATAALAAFGIVFGGSPRAGAVTAPTVTYQMFDNTCSFGGPCRERVTIRTNPNNNSTRAYVNCYNAVPNTQYTVVGSWVTSIGATSTTPSCDGLGRSSSAGFEFRKTNTLFVQCWFRGGSWGPGGC